MTNHFKPLTPPLATSLCQMAVAVKIVLLFALAFNSRFVMDEFWHMSQANYLFDGFFDTILPEKAVGYAVFFKLAHLIGQGDSASIMLAGRILSVLLALGLVATVFGLTRSLKRSSWEALLAVLLLLCFSNFMERSFRLRSEPLAILFAALALLIAIRGDIDRTSRLLLAGFFCGLSFITTQKAVYFNVALGVGLAVDAILGRRFAAIARRSGLLFLGWSAAVIVYILAFGGLQSGIVAMALFLGPLEVATSAQSYYSNLQAFVLQTLLRNAPLYTLCFTGLAIALVRLRHASPSMRVHAVFTMIVTVLVFTHNQPWPYVFTMALPFLASYGIIAVDLLSQRISSRLFAILLAIVVAASFPRNFAYLAHDNSEQLQTVREAEGLISPAGTYFDGIGMLPARRMTPYLWLDAMGIAKTLKAGPESSLMHAFAMQAPDLVILTYRTDLLLPLFGQKLTSEYYRVTPDLLLRDPRQQAAVADLRTHRNLFEGVYAF